MGREVIFPCPAGDVVGDFYSRFNPPWGWHLSNQVSHASRQLVV